MLCVLGGFNLGRRSAARILVVDLDDLLARVYQTDLSKPLPDRLARLVSEFEKRERELSSEPAELH